MNNDSISVLIKRASNVVRRRFEKSLNYVSSELTAMSGLLLKYLDDHIEKNVFLTDLEAEFSIRKSSLTEMINSLERKGYVRKSSIDGDGRYKKITITAQGQELNNHFNEVATAFEEEMLSILTEEETNAIKSGLLKIINLLK